MKNTIILAVLVFLVAAGGSFVFTKRANEAQATKEFLEEYQALVDKENAGTATSTHSTTGTESHGSNQESNSSIDLTNQPEVVMNIKDFKYEKQDIRIKKGTKVTWVNQDAMEHNVMLEHINGDKAHGAPKANEVDSTKLAGPLLAKGESYSFIFNKVGLSPYHCSPHPYMKGSVSVVE